MSNHEIAARADNWVIATIAGVVLLSLLAQSQRRHEADGRAARAHVVKQAKTAAQPETWAKLERTAKK